MKKEHQPSKTWWITINNPTEHDILKLHEWTSETTYLKACQEVGSEKGTPHIHAKMTFRRAYRLTALQKIAPGKHWDDKESGDALYLHKMDGGSTILIDHKVIKEKKNQFADIQEDILNGITTRELWMKYPGTMIRMHRGVYEMIAQLAPRNPPMVRTMDSFKVTPNWTYDKSIIIWGPSETGKTGFARACLPKALMVTHIDDIKKFDPREYDGLIFDDMSFIHLPRESQIHLVDTEEDRSIHCRHTTGLIPRNTKKIFTTNVQDGCIFMDDPAINRRITRFEVQSDIRNL